MKASAYLFIFSIFLGWYCYLSLTLWKIHMWCVYVYICHQHLTLCIYIKRARIHSRSLSLSLTENKERKRENNNRKTAHNLQLQPSLSVFSLSRSLLYLNARITSHHKCSNYNNYNIRENSNLLQYSIL